MFGLKGRDVDGFPGVCFKAVKVANVSFGLKQSPKIVNFDDANMGVMRSRKNIFIFYIKIYLKIDFQKLAKENRITLYSPNNVFFIVIKRNQCHYYPQKI